MPAPLTRCPHCGGRLHLEHDAEGDELVCLACSRRRPLCANCGTGVLSVARLGGHLVQTCAACALEEHMDLGSTPAERGEQSSRTLRRNRAGKAEGASR